jgi:hypothetical protein
MSRTDITGQLDRTGGYRPPLSVLGQSRGVLGHVSYEHGLGGLRGSFMTSRARATVARWPKWVVRAYNSVVLTPLPGWFRAWVSYRLAIGQTMPPRYEPLR